MEFPCSPDLSSRGTLMGYLLGNIMIQHAQATSGEMTCMTPCLVCAVPLARPKLASSSCPEEWT